MAAGNDIHIKIQALIEGLNEVSALTSELEGLDQAGKIEIPDNTREMREGADDTSSSLGSLQGNITKIVAAAGGLAAIGAYLKSSAGEVMDYDTRMRVLEQTIKATGGAAGFSAEEIRELSRELALATLGSVEGFEKASAKLLTFKSVTGETFTQALELSQDLAQNGFGTLESNAVQLGKALEDPVKGLTALTRSGVSFSEEQQNVIRQLVETGRQAEAQAMILEAVAGQVGGVGRAAAEGLAGSFDTLAQRFEEVRLATGKAIEPALTAFWDELADVLVFVAENMETIISVAKVLGATLLAIGAQKVLASLTAVAVQMGGIATAAGGATAATRLLSVAMRALPLIGTVALITQLVPVLIEWRKEARAAAEATELLAETEERLNQRLREISESTGVAVSSMEEFNAAAADGRIVWDAATATWLSAADAAEQLAEAEAKAAREARNFADESTAAGRAAAELQRQFEADQAAARALADHLKAIADESENAAEELRALVDGVNLADAAELGTLLQAITLLETEAADLAETVQQELIAGLQRLNSADLLAFGDNLRQALDEGRLSAERFAQVNDGVLAESLRRLGLTVDEALGRIPDAGAEAVAAFEAVVQSLRAAKLPTEEYERAIASAMAATIPKVDTLEGLNALRERVAAMGEAGLITAENVAVMADKIAAAEKAMQDASGGAAGLSYSFRDLAANANAAEDAIKRVGEAGEQSESDLRRYMQAKREWFQAVLNEGIAITKRWSDATEQLYHKLRGATNAANDMAESQRLAAGDVDALRARSDELAGALREVRFIQQTMSQGSLTRWAAMMSEAAYRAERAYLDQRIAMEKVIEAAEAGEMSMRDLDRATQHAEDRFGLLNDTDMSRLHAAIDGAQQRMEALRESTENTLQSLEDELLRLQGNEDELARRRLERREAELRAQLAEARALGDQQSIKSLEASLSVLQRIGSEEERQRRERALEDQRRAAKQEKDLRERQAEEERRRRERKADAAAREQSRDTRTPATPAPVRTPDVVRHDIRVGNQTVSIETAPGQDAAIEQLLRAIEADLARAQ